MVLVSEPPRLERRHSASSTVSHIRSNESLRSGYVFAHGKSSETTWFSSFMKNVVMCGCVCADRDAKGDKLTMEEVKYMEELRVVMEEPFDSTNADHEMLLSSIWNRAYPGSAHPHPVDPLWKDLGFQSSNPRTDIRTGVHSLVAMEYMSRVHETVFRRIVHEANRPQNEYPFAASCVSVAFSILIFFHLNLRTSVNPSGNSSGNKLAIKQFVRLSMANRDTLNEIFSQVMIRVHTEWMKQRPGSFDIHYFATALGEGVGAMSTLFKERRVKDLADLVVISQEGFS
jgi:hypothetical protein